MIRIAQGSEIVPVAGAQLVGPLPGDLASTTTRADELIEPQSGRTSAPIIPHHVQTKRHCELRFSSLG